MTLRKHLTSLSCLFCTTGSEWKDLHGGLWKIGIPKKDFNLCYNTPLPTVWHPARIFFLTHLLPAGHRSNAAEIVIVQLQSNSLLGAAAHAKNSSPLTEENSRTSWLHPQIPVQNGGYWSMLKVWDSLLLCCQPTSWIPSLWTTPRSIPPLQPSDWAIFMWHSDFSAWKAMEDCYWYIRRPRECMFFITGGFQGALNPLGCHNLYEVRVLPYREGLPLELFYCMHEVWFVCWACFFSLIPRLFIVE